MNQKIKVLLSAVLLASTSAFAASTSMVKGEYNRPNAYLPDLNTRVEYDFCRLHSAEKNDDAVGFTVGAVGFWHHMPTGSRGGQAMADGFAPRQNRAIAIDGAAEATHLADSLYVDYFVLGRAATDAATMTFDKVEHSRIGARAGFNYALDNFYEGLWLGLNATVLYERNKLTMKYENGTSGNSADELAKYFRGEANSFVAGDRFTAASVTSGAQDALAYLKIDSGKILSDTALNDVELLVGLKVVNTDNANVCVMLAGDVPTGVARKRDYLFQAVPGNRNIKVGAGACATIKLVTEEAYAINFSADAQWRYGFNKKNEKIIPQHSSVGFAHYRLVAADGASKATPLANVLVANNVDVDVESKNELNALAQVSFEKGCFGLDLGYNLFWTQEKTLKINGTLGDKDSNKYYFVGRNWVPSSVTGATNHVPAVFAHATHADANNTAVIALSDFMDTTPAHVMHKVYVGATCLFSDWEFPLLVGLTGSYAFNQKRTVTPEVWGVSARVGVSF